MSCPPVFAGCAKVISGGANDPRPGGARHSGDFVEAVPLSLSADVCNGRSCVHAVYGPRQRALLSLLPERKAASRCGKRARGKGCNERCGEVRRVALRRLERALGGPHQRDIQAGCLLIFPSISAVTMLASVTGACGYTYHVHDVNDWCSSIEVLHRS